MWARCASRAMKHWEPGASGINLCRTRVEIFLDVAYLSLPLKLALWIVFWAVVYKNVLKLFN